MKCLNVFFEKNNKSKYKMKNLNNSIQKEKINFFNKIIKKSEATKIPQDCIKKGKHEI